MKSVRRVCLMLFASLALIAIASGPSVNLARADTGAILTVTGEIQQTNRPSFDAFADALFNGLGESFDAAYAFSHADLAAMPQTELTVRYPNWPTDVTIRGPLLSDVLDRVGATGPVVSAQAVDGYAPTFSIDEIRNAPFVLGIQADGKPLSIGGRGPVWLVFPPGSIADQSTTDDGNVPWAVFHIKVSEEE